MQSLKNIKLLIVIFIILSCCFTSFSKNKNDDLLVAARNGDANAQFEVGYEFFTGKNRPRNVTLGVYFFGLSAKQNNPNAIYNLGIANEFGIGCEKNLHKAFELYNKASKLQINAATLRVSRFLFGGIPKEKIGDKVYKEIPSNREKSIEILNELINKNYLDAYRKIAQFAMRNMQYNILEHSKIRPYLKHAAKNGKDAQSWLLLAECYRDGIGGSVDNNLMVNALEEAVKLNNSKAMFELSQYYQYAITPNLEKALKYLKMSVKYDSQEGQLKLADCLLQGVLLPEDINQAFIIYEKLVKERYTPAMQKLGDCYFWGIGTQKNLNKAIELYSNAAAYGDANAQYKYAMCYINGTGIKQDFVIGTYWLELSAKQMHVEAMRELGICLIKGTGIHQDIPAGKKLIEQSAALGDSNAAQLINNSF